MRTMTLEECQAYWRHPPGKQQKPEAYAHRRDAGLLFEIIRRYISKDASILELGCNMGRNLLQLQRAGYYRLTGVEISPAAVAYFRERYPDSTIKILEIAIEDCIADLPYYDLIFTKATLCHLHPDSEWVFAEMVLRSDYILTIENEKTSRTDGRIFSRHYRAIFEDLGMSQTECWEDMPGASGSYKARIFKR